MKQYCEATRLLDENRTKVLALFLQVGQAWIVSTHSLRNKDVLGRWVHSSYDKCCLE